MLRVSDVSTFCGSIQALKDVGLEVREGEIATLIRDDGAGKTTMLKTIAGLLKPRSGSIEFCSADISRLRAFQVVKMGISLCPEGRMVFPRMTGVRDWKDSPVGAACDLLPDPSVKEAYLGES